MDPIIEEMVADDTNENSAKKEDPRYGPWLLVSYGKGNRNSKGRHGRTGNGYTSVVEKSGSTGKSDGSNASRKKDGEYSDAKGGKNNQVKNGSKDLKIDMAKAAATQGSGSRFDILIDELDERVLETDISRLSKDTGTTIQKGKAVLLEITNQSNKHKENLNRIPSQNSKKKPTKSVKLGGNDSLLSKKNKTGGADSSKSNSDSKDRKHHQEFGSSITDNEEVGSDNVLQQLHKEVTEFETLSLKSKVTDDRLCSKGDMPNKSSVELIASNLKEAIAVLSE